LSTHHYLDHHHLVGKSLKYVAEFDGEWVALLGWASPAFQCGARDTWIGWGKEQQWQRLKYVVNNVRFLILPGVRIAHLASKALALNSRRLSADWVRVCGHPIVLAETFVGPQRFLGTCYQVANWRFLGQTSGYWRQSGEYYYRGQHKTVWVYPLHRKARQMLTAPFLAPALEGRVGITDLNQAVIEQPGGLLQRLEKLVDVRKRRGVRHTWVSVFAVATCAILSGADGFRAIGDWAQSLSQENLEHLGCRFNERTKRYEPPSEPTLRRSLQSVDAEDLDAVMNEWIREQTSSNAIAVDGKALRGAKREKGQPLSLFAALLHWEGLVLAQRAVDTKHNEITEFQPLLEPLDIKGIVVTADALHTQAEHAKYLKEKKEADYVFTVKGNRQTLLSDIQALDDDDFSPAHKVTEKDHGRIETRLIQVSEALEGHTTFPYARQVFRIERTVSTTQGEFIRQETVFGIKSLSPQRADAATRLELNRGHWEIENRLHRVRDVTFDENRSCVRTKESPPTMATLRNLAISLFRLQRSPNIARALRQNSWNAEPAIQMSGA
jgi:predicted transposase YbfD/YdcC